MLVLTAFLVVLQAGDGPSRAPDVDRMVGEIIGTFESSMAAFIEQIEAAEAAGGEFPQGLEEPDRDRTARELLAVVEAHPDDPAVARGLAWVITYRPGGPEGDRALREILERHAASDRLGGDVCISLIYSHHPEAEALLRRILEENPHSEVRASACFSLGRFMQVAAEREGRGAFNSYTRKPGGPSPEEEAVALFERCIAEFAEFDAGHRNAGERAREALFELKSLAVGLPVPDLEGLDLDGNPIRLEDYRGKVVVLTFWASWCGPCMEMVPHERELAERYRDRPFAVVGVNGDEGLDDALGAVERAGIDWRSFRAVEAGGRSIAEEWNVSRWPTNYVIDGDGVIRYRNVFYGALDRAVTDLMMEAE